MSKVLLAIGNDELEELFEKIETIEIIEKERDLEVLKDLLEFMNVDYLVINRLLDEDGKNLLDIAVLAKKKNIKVIVLLNDLEDFSEKKIITSLVAQDVYSFINFNDLKEEKIINIIENYPQEFDFKIFNNDDQQVNDGSIIKNVKKRQGKKRETIEVELINNAVIAVYSNCSSGKSVVSWILAYCLKDRNYKTAVINLDKGYSANIYYPISSENNNEVMDMNSLLQNEELGYKVDKDLSVICGSLGSKMDFQPDQFLKILNAARIKNNITIVDCKSELNDLTKIALQQSTIDLLVYDNDINHCSLNNQMIQDLGAEFNPEKTIMVINNAAIESKSYKEILSYLEDSGMNFRDIVSIRSVGGQIFDLIDKNKLPYLSKSVDDNFKKDIDNLLLAIKSRDYKKNKLARKKFFKMFLIILVAALIIFLLYRFQPWIIISKLLGGMDK